MSSGAGRGALGPVRRPTTGVKEGSKSGSTRRIEKRRFCLPLYARRAMRPTAALSTWTLATIAELGLARIGCGRTRTRWLAPFMLYGRGDGDRRGDAHRGVCEADAPEGHGQGARSPWVRAAFPCGGGERADGAKPRMDRDGSVWGKPTLKQSVLARREAAVFEREVEPADLEGPIERARMVNMEVLARARTRGIRA